MLRRCGVTHIPSYRGGKGPHGYDTAWQKGHLVSGELLPRVPRYPLGSDCQWPGRSFPEALIPPGRRAIWCPAHCSPGSLNVRFPACQEFLRTPGGDDSLKGVLAGGTGRSNARLPGPPSLGPPLHLLLEVEGQRRVLGGACRMPPLCHRGAAPSKQVVRRGPGR